jgi:hypothetical protein
VAILSFGTMAHGDADVPATMLRCEVVDADSGKPLPARVYVRTADGRWLFVRSASPEGSAVVYDKQRLAECVEKHTTVSAHPFVVDVPQGKLTVRIERGKEYLPVEKTVEVGKEPVRLRVELKRWIDMAATGWYSGDTHVHRKMDDLPNLLMAEDLNVGLPLTYWVTAAYLPPSSGKGKAAPPLKTDLICVDPTHVIYPVNTEYEIFTVGHKRHTLGAVFALGHRTPFTCGVPPVRPFVDQARQQGAILDLDKHSWPWSLMLVPVAEVDLFELANNHCWRTEFGFRRWTIDTVPAYMKIERDMNGLSEWGWIDFGFQTYYALLNCGFRMRPSAGTASGVHPVPLGFGRVYVHLPDGFSYERWMKGLAAGRSFVTTGPMLMVEVDGQPPGSSLGQQSAQPGSYRITGTAASARPLRPIEILAAGQVVAQIPAANRKTENGGYESPIDARIQIDGSSWIAVRVFEDRPDGRIRFAHSSPVHIEVNGRPLRPRREEVEYLVSRMKEEIQRNQDVLRPDELEEYRQALSAFESRAAIARRDESD